MKHPNIIVKQVVGYWNEVKDMMSIKKVDKIMLKEEGKIQSFFCFLSNASSFYYPYINKNKKSQTIISKKMYIELIREDSNLPLLRLAKGRTK